MVNNVSDMKIHLFMTCSYKVSSLATCKNVNNIEITTVRKKRKVRSKKISLKVIVATKFSNKGVLWPFFYFLWDDYYSFYLEYGLYFVLMVRFTRYRAVYTCPVFTRSSAIMIVYALTLTLHVISFLYPSFYPSYSYEHIL